MQMSVRRILAEQTPSAAIFQDRSCVSVETDSSWRIVPMSMKTVEETKQEPTENYCARVIVANFRLH